jgi:polysaccharide export outer membrane protein
MRRILSAGLIALAAVVATASRSQVAPVQAVIPGVDTQAPSADSSIAPLDHLDVVVFREPDLSAQDIVVNESGQIALPLVGEFTAAGKSTEVLATEIAEKLRQYVYYPKVSITVTQPASRRITVAGSVVQPGVYPMEGRMTLLQAVALARGPSRVAAMDQAFIFRTRDGQRVAAKFNLDAIAKGKAADPEVISGDTVTLGSSGFKTAWRDILDTVSSFSIWKVLP